MKINDKSGLNSLDPTANQSAVRKSEHSPAKRLGVAADETQVSVLGKKTAEAKAVADTLPDMRMDRVELARERLASGYYDTPEARDALIASLSNLIRDTSL